MEASGREQDSGGRLFWTITWAEEPARSVSAEAGCLKPVFHEWANCRTSQRKGLRPAPRRGAPARRSMPRLWSRSVSRPWGQTGGGLSLTLGSALQFLPAAQWPRERVLWVSTQAPEDVASWAALLLSAGLDHLLRTEG